MKCFVVHVAIRAVDACERCPLQQVTPVTAIHEEEKYAGRGNYPCQLRKKRFWLKKLQCLFHHKAGTKRASGDLEGCWKHLTPELGWRSTLDSTRSLVVNCAPSDNMFVGALYTMCKEFACKLASSLVSET
eukprot:1139057-Pelagomonas_calceolata.AAC.3